MSAPAQGPAHTPLTPAVARRWAAALLLAVAAGGCSTLQYYGQAIAGQFDVIARAVPVTDQLDDPAVSGASFERAARSFPRS